MTPLMYASYKGGAELVAFLLQHGADVNIDTHKDRVFLYAHTVILPLKLHAFKKKRVYSSI